MRQRDSISEEEIKKKLCKHYGTDPQMRKMIKCHHYDNHDTLGTIFYSISGSPPKGWAVYVKSRRLLSLYDGRGKRFSIYRGIRIEELEEEEGLIKC